MPVKFDLPHYEKEEYRTMEHFKCEYSLLELAKNFNTKPSTPEELSYTTALFLGLDYISKLEYGLLYLHLLEGLCKINLSFNDEKLLTALKIIIDIKQLGRNLAKEEEVAIPKEVVAKILGCEAKVLSQLDVPIAQEKKAKESQLIQKFNTLKLSKPINQPYPFKDFPEQDIWRFYVDGKKQKMVSEHGWVKYETREKNCLEGMHKAFLYALETINEKLDIDLMQKIHSLAVSGVSAIKQTGLRNKDITIILKPEMYSLLGLDEYLNEETLIKFQRYWRFTYTYSGSWVLVIEPSKFQGNIEDVFANIINGYNERLQATSDRYLILKAIVRLSMELVRWHAFIDGNARVFVNIILNRELIKHGFPPVILEDPNYFDNYSHTELCLETLNGMENFKYVCEKRNYPGADATLSTPAIIDWIKNLETEKSLNCKIKPISKGFVHEPFSPPVNDSVLQNAATFFKDATPINGERGSDNTSKLHFIP